MGGDRGRVKRRRLPAPPVTKVAPALCSSFPVSGLIGPEISGEFDGVGDGDVDVAQLNFTQRQRFKRNFFALELPKERIESAAGERADGTVAFALQVRNFGD